MLEVIFLEIIFDIFFAKLYLENHKFPFFGNFISQEVESLQKRVIYEESFTLYTIKIYKKQQNLVPKRIFSCF